MSESGHFSSSSSGRASGNYITTPTEDTQPPGTYQHGNFAGTNPVSVRNYMSGINQLATTAQPVFTNISTPRPESQNSKNYDIVPEISHIYDQYKSEKKRLETFYDWPSNAAVKKEDLARNGFIFLHSKDRTQCAFCRGVLSSWEPGDVVEEEHKKHCPECPFAFGYECGNIPQRNGITLYRNVADSRPAVVSHPVNVTLEPQSAFEMTSMLPALPSVGQPAGTNVSTTTPKYREWGDEYKRVRSFKNWPTQMTQTPIELAKAGLLYMGNGDRVKCFWCGGELYDWEPADTPWEEHAKWFPNCGYVRAMKGDAYIQSVKDKQVGEQSASQVDERMTRPHVLAVLREGYSQEEVREAFSRFGENNLFNAPKIAEAIHQLRQERQAAFGAVSGRVAQAWTPQTQSQELEAMETEETLPKETSTESSSKASTGSSSKASTGAAEQKISSDNSDVESVRQENAKLKDEKLCKICMDSELCMTFLPCGHLATCEKCSKNLPQCPICRMKVLQTVKIFWS